MTDKGFYVTVEVSGPFQKRPHLFRSRYCIKIMWLFFGIYFYNRPTHEIYRLQKIGHIWWPEAEEYARKMEE